LENEMSDRESQILRSDEEIALLLKATKASELRMISLARLRRILQTLTDVCEVSRTDALRNIADRQGDGLRNIESDDNYRFADLFAALRRVRAELNRRA